MRTYVKCEVEVHCSVIEGKIWPCDKQKTHIFYL